MAWIGLSDQSEARFALSGLGADAGRAETARLTNDPSALLTRGSIVIEAQLSPYGNPQMLLSWRRNHVWESAFSVQAIPGGGIVLVVQQGDDVFHAALRHEVATAGEAVRITYSWDAPGRWARLAVEDIGGGNVAMTVLKSPKPLLLGDLLAVVRDPLQRHVDNDVRFFAVSTEIEPIGPLPSLTAQVPILTPYGYRMAGQLKRGDRVVTLGGEIAPVLEVVKRVVPARGAFRPVRLRAPCFGLRQDIIVGPDQRMVISGSDVEYMFGEERVLVPARHLVNGIAAQYCPGGITATYHQLILPQHQAVVAAGAALETLFLGRIRRKPEALEASLLAGMDRNALPEHGRSAYPVLKKFEAITLAQKRAAQARCRA